MAVKLTEQTRIEVARDYHFSGLFNREIAQKFNISPEYVSELGRKHTKEFLKSLDDSNESIIIVRSSDLLLAQLAIEEYGIKIIKPDNIIIEQQYVSKL